MDRSCLLYSPIRRWENGAGISRWCGVMPQPQGGLSSRTPTAMISINTPQFGQGKCGFGGSGHGSGNRVLRPCPFERDVLPRHYSGDSGLWAELGTKPDSEDAAVKTNEMTSSLAAKQKDLLMNWVSRFFSAILFLLKISILHASSATMFLVSIVTQTVLSAPAEPQGIDLKMAVFASMSSIPPANPSRLPMGRFFHLEDAAIGQVMVGVPQTQNTPLKTEHSTAHSEPATHTPRQP